MKLEDVQAYVAAQIAANTTLAALGSAILYSHFTADEDARAAIASALRATGVCFEVGAVEATGDTTKPHFRYTLVDAKFDVFIAENPKVAHSPQEMPLVALAATAIQSRVNPADPSIKCEGYSAAKSENGYVLHVLSFTVPATL